MASALIVEGLKSIRDLDQQEHRLHGIQAAALEQVRQRRGGGGFGDDVAAFRARADRVQVQNRGMAHHDPRRRLAGCRRARIKPGQDRPVERFLPAFADHAA